MNKKWVKIGLSLFAVFGVIYLVLFNYDGSPIWEYHYMIPVLVGYNHVDPVYITGSGAVSLLGVALIIYGITNNPHMIEKQ